MKTSCISHPASEPLIVLHAWQQQAFGDAVVGALISYFEYWHNVKLSGAPERKHLRVVAKDHGDLSIADIDMLQYHTQDEIEEGLLGIAKKTKIKSAIAILADEGIVSRHNNPNDRYKFDRTIYYLFSSTLINEFLHFRGTAKLHWSNTTDVKKKGFSYSWTQFKADKVIFGQPSVEYDSPSVANDHSSVANDLAITEITPETTSENKVPHSPPQAGETIAPQITEDQGVVKTCLSSQEGDQAMTTNSDPETKRRRRAAAPKKPGPGDRFSHDGMTDKQRQCRVIALRKEYFNSEEDVIALVGPEVGERIRRNWAWYKSKCSDLPQSAGIGDQTSAAIAMVILCETDFLGYGVDGFRKGCTLFAKRIADKKGSGTPACARFLVGKSGEQPYWVQELVRAEPTAKVSDPAGEVLHRPAVDQEEVSRRLVEQARAEFDRERESSQEQGAA